MGIIDGIVVTGWVGEIVGGLLDVDEVVWVIKVVFGVVVLISAVVVGVVVLSSLLHPAMETKLIIKIVVKINVKHFLVTIYMLPVLMNLCSK